MENQPSTTDSLGRTGLRPEQGRARLFSDSLGGKREGANQKLAVKEFMVCSRSGDMKGAYAARESTI